METRGSIRFLYGANRNSAPPIVGFGPQEGCPLPPVYCVPRSARRRECLRPRAHA
jgi:hypothetical protein